MSTNPVRVCSFESRRQIEMTKLIEKFGGIPTVAPSMKEVSLNEQPSVHEFADKLLAGEIDVTIFLTGVGTDSLFEALKDRLTEEELAERIRQTFVAVRGPKPAAALAKKKIKPELKAPEPNTWEDLVSEFEKLAFDFSNKLVAIQEYGAPSKELYDWLQAKGAKTLPVSIYRWELPDDIGPLQSAIRGIIDGEFDLILWTTAQQFVHATQVAEEMNLKEEWLAACGKSVNASIGPTATARIQEYGVTPAMEPSHPKMAHLVREAIDFLSK